MIKDRKMSRCNKCFRLYASEWQSDRCCPPPIRMFRPIRTDQLNNGGSIYVNNESECKISSIWMIIFLVLISLFNPFLSLFIAIIYLYQIKYE